MIFLKQSVAMRPSDHGSRVLDVLRQRQSFEAVNRHGARRIWPTEPADERKVHQSRQPDQASR
jgi:hypothetical protein